LQRVEEMELKHRKKLEEWKTLKKIQEVKAMFDQNKKMDESHQGMENLHSTESRGNRGSNQGYI